MKGGSTHLQKLEEVVEQNALLIALDDDVAIVQAPKGRTQSDKRLAMEYLEVVANASILAQTSTNFICRRKKEYGNVDADEYVEWLLPFATEIKRVLTDDGSFVLDLGGSWVKGLPIRSLYHYEVIIAFTRRVGFYLVQEFFWHNTAKLPTPAEWVTVRRVRVKDSVNTVWWFSKTPTPKANNRNVLVPYSASMLDLLANGYKPKLRPSGHDISDKFQRDNGGAIPSNLLQIANTESNSEYQRLCKIHGLKPHPARFPRALPEFFIKMLSAKGDLVLDPFGGSMVTGAACEALNRRWIGIDIMESYVEASKFRFGPVPTTAQDDCDRPA